MLEVNAQLICKKITKVIENLSKKKSNENDVFLRILQKVK